jgi:hypothetical protein
MTIRSWLNLAVPLALICLPSDLYAQNVFRIEVKPIETVTLKTQQVLTGEPDGKPRPPSAARIAFTLAARMSFGSWWSSKVRSLSYGLPVGRTIPCSARPIRHGELVDSPTVMPASARPWGRRHGTRTRR